MSILRDGQAPPITKVESAQKQAKYFVLLVSTTNEVDDVSTQ